MTTADREKVIMACAKDPFFFGKIVAPQFFSEGFATFHRHMIDEVNNRPAHCSMVVLEVPRGFGKSAIISTLNPLHRCIFGGVKYVIVASFSSSRANKIIGDFGTFIKGTNFQGIFPGTVIIRDREDLIEVKNSELGFNFQIMARGRDSQIAGMRFEEARPQIFIGDDLEDPEESYNQSIVDKNEAFVDGVVQYGLDPKIGYSILIGTPFAFDCITGRIGRRSTGVRRIVYPGLVDNHRFPKMSEKLGIPEGHSIWEERFSTEYLLKKRDDAITNNSIDHFMRNIMLDPSASGGVRIPIEKIKRIKPEDIESVKRISMNVYILSDYAYSRKIWADESAYMVVGIDDESNHYILASDSGKWGDIGTTDKIIDKVLEYKSKLRVVGVESRGLGFIERRLSEIRRQYNLSFAVEELKPKNRSKAERIKGTIAMFDDGRVFMVDNQNKFVNQASRFRGEEMDHGDDILDCWGYIREDFVHKPVTQKTEEERLKQENHVQFERWAKSWNDRVAKGETRRVRHAMGMRPNYF